MKKNIRIILALLVVLIFISSCVGKKIKEPEETQKEVTEVEKEETQTDISGDISDVDTLEQDLDMSELENLDKDLDAVDWE